MFAKLTKTNDAFGLPIISAHRAKPVTVGSIQHPKAIFTIWSDAALNAIGYARMTETRIPTTKISRGYIDTFVNGQVTRAHSTADKPITPDPEPTIFDEETGLPIPNPHYDYRALRQRDYPTTEEMIVALWEKNMEARPEAAITLEVKRQTTKVKHPKPTGEV